MKIKLMTKKLVSLTMAAGLTMSVLSTSVQAKNYYGHANDYLQYGVGARSLAMGSAFTGLVNDASAPYYNPAGLSLLDDFQIMAMHAPFFMDTMLNYFACVYPFGPRGSVSVSAVMLYSDKFEGRNNVNTVTSSNETIQNNTGIVSYGVYLWKGISAGVNVKLYQESVFGTSGTAMGADLGAMYQPFSMVSFGLLFSNLNEPSITLDETPNYYRRNIKFGTAFKTLGDKLIITSDVNKLREEKSYFTFGMEVNPVPYVSARLGLNQYSEITYGVGFKISPISIDYAYSPHDIGNLSRVSFNFYWGNVYRARIKPSNNLDGSRKSIELAGLHNEVKFKTDIPDFIIKHWELAILDDNEKVVKKLEGDYRPKDIIIWDALDKDGSPVPKGKYNYEFKITYKNDKKWVEKGQFAFDLSASNENAVEIKVNNREYPQFNEPPEARQLEEVPAEEIPVAPEEVK
ncbi:MAG: PorV/PorQ family protein [bacterium]